MLVIGIDPGTVRLGWGVVGREGSRLVHVAHGVVSPPTDSSLALRLCWIHEALGEVLSSHHPACSAVETLFVHRDPLAAAKLGHARGVVLLALARKALPIAEYQPARVKRTVAGNGQATKRQVALMVRALLGLDAPPPSDAADALAVAVTHLRIGTLASTVQSHLHAARARRPSSSTNRPVRPFGRTGKRSVRH